MDTDKTPAATARAVISRARYQTTVTHNHHVLIADEPTENDGTDLGFSPHNLLLASLGSCTAITLRMYIDRKQWDVDEISVNLELYNQDDGSTLIETFISVKGNIDTLQKERLMHIANVCPIHKLLTNPVKIETRGIHML